MDGSPPRKRATAKQGLRALDACGDGFWELDLEEGAAWFSAWFYEKLRWKPESKRATLTELERHLAPASWKSLMAAFRAHLEQGQTLDIGVEVSIAANQEERWRVRGRAHRSASGQPVYVAGSMSQVETAPSGTPEVLGVIAAFDALPVAAALLDGHAKLLQANRQWQSLPSLTAGLALARLPSANSHTAIEFWLDQGEEVEASARHLRVRAVAFQHVGSRHLVVTLEDRRSD